MNEFSLALALLSSGIWLGSIVFLSLVLAPIVFKALSPTGASHLLRALFPRYYKTGIACGVILHLALIYYISQSGIVTMPVLWSAFGSACILLMTVYSLYLIPKINSASDAGYVKAKTFNRLHKRSVIINIFNLLITLAVFINLVIALQYATL